MTCRIIDSGYGPLMTPGILRLSFKFLEMHFQQSIEARGAESVDGSDCGCMGLGNSVESFLARPGAFQKKD